MTKVCSKCNIEKSADAFYSAHSSYKGKTYLRGECKNCCTLYRRQMPKDAARAWEKKNKERRLAQKRTPEYQAWERQYSKRPEVAEKRRQRRKARYRNDEMYRLTCVVRSRILDSVKKHGWKKHRRSHEYIGCDLNTLKSHIEAQFQLGMTWDNFGTWEIDHIIPLSSANFPEELVKLSHYTNLQPLWKSDNRKKSDKILDTAI